MEFSQTRVLVTGASSGIGRATAVRLAKEREVTLILSGRDEARLRETWTLCGERAEDVLWPRELDNAWAAGEALQEFLKARQLSVQAFVHCAGMAPLLPLRLADAETAHRIMEVNFFSAAALLETLISRRDNRKELTRVVLISSVQSQIGAKGQGFYCASKAALEGFLRAMAEELGPRVRVNAIRPGAVPSRMADELTARADLLTKDVAEGYTLGLGMPEDIASMVAFLLSEEARWITGQCFTVDGGRMAH